MLIAADQRHSKFHKQRHNSKQPKQGDNTLLLSLVGLVCRHTCEDVSVVLAARRGQKSVAESRQLAMYLLHIVAGVNFSTIGELFARDRTTVAHACACVEDRRECVAYDAMVSRMEEELQQQLQAFRGRV